MLLTFGEDSPQNSTWHYRQSSPITLQGKSENNKINKKQLNKPGKFAATVKLIIMEFAVF